MLQRALRHRLLQQEGPRRLPRTRSRRPRSATTACSASSSAVHHQPAGRHGPDPLDAQGGHRPRHPRKLHQGRAGQARLLSRSTPRTSAGSSCTRPAATIPYYHDAQFPPLKMPADAAAMELLDGLIAGSLDDDAQQRPAGQGGHPRAACRELDDRPPTASKSPATHPSPTSR